MHGAIFLDNKNLIKKVPAVEDNTGRTDACMYEYILSPKEVNKQKKEKSKNMIVLLYETTEFPLELIKIFCHIGG